MYRSRFFRFRFALVLWAGCVAAGMSQTEVYSHMFRNGSDHWLCAVSSELKERTSAPHVEWESVSESDSTGKGFVFRNPECDKGDFLFLFKAFAGLQPNSYYKISSLASFTIAKRETPVDNDLYLKIGTTMSRPRVLSSGRPNFSKGEGPVSGKNLSYVGAIHTGKDPEEHRFFSQNYDAPVLASTNHEGVLYLVVGIEPSPTMKSMPEIRLNTIRILFDLVGEDSSLMDRDFKIDITDAEQPKSFRYHIFPDENILGYHIYSPEGHLILVEEDADCVPECPHLINASMLDPGRYFIEFVLVNRKRIVKILEIR